MKSSLLSERSPIFSKLYALHPALLEANWYEVKRVMTEGSLSRKAKYKADGAIEKEGKVAGCIGCHTAAIKNDWVFNDPVK
jgi:hypothetical protein